MILITYNPNTVSNGLDKFITDVQAYMNPDELKIFDSVNQGKALDDFLKSIQIQLSLPAGTKIFGTNIWWEITKSTYGPWRVNNYQLLKDKSASQPVDLYGNILTYIKKQYKSAESSIVTPPVLPPSSNDTNGSQNNFGDIFSPRNMLIAAGIFIAFKFLGK